MIVPDTNLLLYAYDSESQFHLPAKAWWETLLSGVEPVGLCPVVIFAFLRLATNNRVFTRPMTAADAGSCVTSWLARTNVRFLVAGPGHAEAVCALLVQAGTAGNLVTDAQIAALAIDYGATVHSADTDFARLPGVRWTNPLLA
jgi:toxin-antitoxin system PIN domain toxin